MIIEKKQRDFLRLRHAKQYDNGTRKNPLFFKAPPKRILLASIIVGSIVLILALCIGFTHLPWFQLTGITIQGGETLSSDTLQQTTQRAIHDRRIPFVSQTFTPMISHGRIRDALMTEFPLDDVRIDTQGNALIITVTERVMHVVWRNAERTMLFNLSGEYVRDATPEELIDVDARHHQSSTDPAHKPVHISDDMPIIVNTNNESAESLPAELVTVILDIQARLRAQGIHTTLVQMDGVRSPWARLITNQPYALLFDLTRDPEAQMIALQSVTGATGFVAPNEYIDLRFGAYVYMK